MVLSVAKRHLERIAFEPQDNEWTAIHTFDRTGSGAPRSRPYEVMARWYDVDGKPSLFIFGPAAQTPFGLISDPQKGKVGAILREVCREWTIDDVSFSSRTPGKNTSSADAFFSTLSTHN